MEINKYIDHTLLKPDSSTSDIAKLCSEASQYHFYSVCINPSMVVLAKSLLKETDVKVCTVIGFPLGATTTEVKVFEAHQAIQNGADEIDMVLHIGQLKEKNDDYVLKDIQAVVDKVHKDSVIVKVIIETSLLTEEEKIKACKIVSESGASFIKTSTGFAGGGATLEDIKLMKSNCSSHLKIKASGGIKTFNQAKSLIDAGASRLGASSGVAILNGQVSQGDY